MSFLPTGRIECWSLTRVSIKNVTNFLKPATREEKNYDTLLNFLKNKDKFAYFNSQIWDFGAQVEVENFGIQRPENRYFGTLLGFLIRANFADCTSQILNFKAKIGIRSRI